MKVLAAVLATLACAMLGLVATSTAATLPAHAAVVSAHVSPSKLGASGGAVEVTGTVRHAVWCQLKLVSHPSLVVVYSHNPKRCATGRYSARVLIGSDGGGKTAAVLRSFIASRKRSGVEPFARFRDVLSRIPAHSITRLSERLPHSRQPANAPAQA